MLLPAKAPREHGASSPVGTSGRQRDRFRNSAAVCDVAEMVRTSRCSCLRELLQRATWSPLTRPTNINSYSLPLIIAAAQKRSMLIVDRSKQFYVTSGSAGPTSLDRTFLVSLFVTALIGMAMIGCHLG